MNIFKKCSEYIKAIKNKPHATVDYDLVALFDNIIFIVCSLTSAFINLIFIANLTKTPYTLGTLLSMPAAIFLGGLSLSLDLSKMNHAMKINSLTELARELGDKPWVGNVLKIKRKWKRVYIAYVFLSILTSVSLSSISIGAGISRNSNLLNSIQEQIDESEKYIGMDSFNKDYTRNSYAQQITDTSEKEAREYADNAVNQIEDFIIEISPILNAEYSDDVDDEGNLIKSADEKKNEALKKFESKRTKINNILRGAGYRARTFEELAAFDTLNLSSDIKRKRLEYLKSNENELALEKLNKFSDSNKEEIIPWLETLNALNLVNPKTGEVVQFSIDENKDPITLAKSANTILKALKVDVENDSGDIGSSSKIFMQVGSWLNSIMSKNNDLNEVLNKKGTGGSGFTSMAMMAVLLFLSLLCELAINQFSPQPKLTRKLVGKFRRYFPKDFDINEFIFEVSKEKYKAMEIDTEEFDRETKICADIAIKSQATLKKIVEEKKKELANNQIKTQEVKTEEKPIRKVRQINREEKPQEEKSTEDALKNALEGLIKKVEQE